MQESSMRFDTNSNLWLMGDRTGNSDSRAAMHKVLGHLFVFIPLHKFVQQNRPRAVFVVVAEVQMNCPAELQHIAPLVFVDNFVF